MPFEIREIMFLLPEFHKALLTFSRASALPEGLEAPDARLIDAMHTHDLVMAGALDREQRREGVPQSRRQTLENALRTYNGPPGKALLLTLGQGAGARTGILLDEDFVQDALVEACRNEHIMLPRAPRKEVVTRDGMVGLRIHMSDTAFRNLRGSMAAS